MPTAESGVHIIGLADRAILESKERVNAAVRSCGFLFPTYKVVVNLAPAQVRKHGAVVDLALALTVLAMDQQIEASRLRDIICLGELALDGAVKPVGGVLPAAIGAKQAGYSRLLLPCRQSGRSSVGGRPHVVPGAHAAASGASRVGPERSRGAQRCLDDAARKRSGASRRGSRRRSRARARQARARGGGGGRSQSVDGRRSRQRQDHAGKAHPEHPSGDDAQRGA